MCMPQVSIVMSVYNGSDFLEEALESIIAQTYKNWECIVIDDCSSDKTPLILEKYTEEENRIIVLRNPVNSGLAASLNRGIAAASGKYIVRMDADDICRPDRIERQVSFMERHPEVSVSSCRFFSLYGSEAVPQMLGEKGDPESIKALFLFFDPILHPGVIAKTEDMREMTYFSEYSRTEDLKLWTEMLIRGKKFAVQGEYLMLYRIHENQVTGKFHEKQREQYKKIILRFYEKMLFCLSEEEVELLAEGIYYKEKVSVEDSRKFFVKVQRENKEKFDRQAVKYAVFDAYKGFRYCGVSRIKMLISMLRLTGALFTLSELLRRRTATHRDIALADEAASMFRLRFKSRQGNVLTYIRGEK